VVLNLTEVKAKDFPTAKDRDTFRRTTRAFPALKKRSVYIGIEDHPTFDGDGYMKLGPNPRVRVGKLQYSLSAAAARLGTSENKIRQQINREFRRLKVTDPAGPAR
jgi:hypothetical protein